MRRALLSLALLMAGTSALPACEYGAACTTEYRWGVNLTIRDARTQQPITTATATLVDGAYRETITLQSFATSYLGAGEREGTYTLTVTAPGYQPSTARTVTVTGDECHVRPVSVTVDLTPSVP